MNPSSALRLLFIVPLAWAVGTASTVRAQAKVKPTPPPISFQGGKLSYEPDARGNRVPDFSYAGYRAGEATIPDIPVRIVLPPGNKDATLQIQKALDQVARLPLNAAGFRGAVLLEKGVYRLWGSLRIHASGVVLRGSGMGENGTVLIAEGTDRETFITVKGVDDRQHGRGSKVKDSYVPVNAMTLSVEDGHSFKPGDLITVKRPSTKEWISELGMEKFGGDNNWLGWKPAFLDLAWERTITKIENNKITLDAPITNSMDAASGGGIITGLAWNGRITNAGVENLRCRSAYDKNNPKDEAHRWMAITMDNIMDGWVRQVVFEHFAGSAVYLGNTVRRITVEDCKSLAPVSEIAAQRRYTFFTSGQQTLFQRIFAEHGYHDFAVGYCTPGPTAFVQCESYLPFNYSGTVESWASGVLMDIVNVDGNSIGFPDRSSDAQGAGYTGANSVIWQCAAAKIILPRPPTANNWAFGTWARYSGDGDWYSSDSHIQPRSLYYGQLADRLGPDVLNRSRLVPVEGIATTSPSLQQAAEMIADAVRPALQLRDWIDTVVLLNPIPVERGNAQVMKWEGLKAVKPVMAAPLEVKNGWLVRGNTVMTGKRQDVSWWRGNVTPMGLKGATDHITRYVPGRTGTGLTDDLDQVTSRMADSNVIGLEHNYGLWYERRRDDHQRVRRSDGDVWPPFYEMPFERSGQGTAWDGLSKYDLTKYNYWYWNRLKTFADLADQKSLVLVHQNYFQHNILEAGAHYADFPWRTANNINNTPFPEPPNYAGDKRIFMSKIFYDTTDAHYRSLHRAYIRKSLDNFSANSGVIQLTSAEFTGPLHFVQFWLDVIGEWEREKGKKALVGLSTTKDVQDAILADPVRSRIVNVIDIRYWAYNSEGKAPNAAMGGVHLAPRQHSRRGFGGGGGGFNQVYQAVRDYRQANPGKAVMYSAGGSGWAAFMAGGSLAALPRIEDRRFLQDAATMVPVDGSSAGDTWMLANPGKSYIVYTKSGQVEMDLTGGGGDFTGVWVNPVTGKAVGKSIRLKGKKVTSVANPGKGDMVLWVRSGSK